MQPRCFLILFLLVAGVVAMPCIAAEITLRPILPFHRSDEACLNVYYDGDAAYWLNHCPYPVSVRWNDEAKCRNWSCIDEVPANARSTAAISRHARWCECRGTLKTCNLPTTGC